MRPFRQEEKMSERWTGLSEAEEKLYDIIVPETEESRIQPDEFAGVRNPNMIAADNKTVENMEAIFRRENSDPGSRTRNIRSKLVEMIVGDQIDNSNLFGENAFAITPSRYDDIENGIDLIVEFKTEAGSVVLAIDLTKSANESEIADKLSGIKKSIENGRLSMIKYFISEDETVSREPLTVPRVIIGADQKTIKNISGLLLLFKTRQKHPAAGKPGEFKETRELLANHKLQFQLLLEIEIQLKAFVSYAEKLGKTIPAQKYKEVLEIIDKILKQKESAENYRPDYSSLEEDGVYKAIIEKTASFEKQKSFKAYGGL